MNKNKWYLMLCELHFPTIHGKTDDSQHDIETHYLVYDIYDPITGISLNYTESDEEFDYEPYDNDETNLPRINYDIISLKQKYFNLSICFTRYLYKHPIIRNYQNIISKPNYIKPEIGEYIILPTHETITILKTFWIRIIQKKWKKVFKQKQTIIRQRCSIQSLKIRQTTGYWPIYCNILPGLKGMLYNLKT
jgi:hypothetical protein